jgi:hypothetical protein
VNPKHVRRRRYDRAILRWVAYHRRVTSHQILWKFFEAEGLTCSYGERVILQLVQRGFLSSEPLEPAHGAASRRVLDLTRDGWRRIGVSPPPGWDRAIQATIREYRLQFAEVLMVRQKAGWRLATPGEAAAHVRAWTLRPYRNRRLNDTERVIRERLERTAIDPLPLHVLVHDVTGDLRFVVPGRRGYGALARLDRMPVCALWPLIEFEVVLSDVALLQRAKDQIDHWAKRRRVSCRTHILRHHRTRPHPRIAMRKAAARAREAAEKVGTDPTPRMHT